MVSIYEIISKNNVGPKRSQTAIWCTRVACWISTATSAHADGQTPEHTRTRTHSPTRQHTHTQTNK